MNVVILSAGLGTRLRPLTEKMAKPAVPFLNLPMLGYSLFLAEFIGPRKIIFNTFHCPATVEQAVEGLVQDSYDVIFSHETPAILGRGGALKKAERYLEGPDFFVFNGDAVNLFINKNDLLKMIQVHQSRRPWATILVTPFVGERGTHSAVWVDRYMQVKGFGPRSPAPDLLPFHYPGGLLVSSRILSKMPSGEFDIFYDSFVQLIAEGEPIAAHLVAEMTSFETGNAVDYLRATQKCLSEMHHQSPSGRALKEILTRFKIDLPMGAKTMLGKRCKIKVSHRGFLVAGHDVSLEGSGDLEDCVIMPGTAQAINESISNEIVY